VESEKNLDRLPGDIINEKCTGSSSIVRASYGTEAFLTGLKFAKQK
jgi:hypothetical protein